jgi:hypothetical protein
VTATDLSLDEKCALMRAEQARLRTEPQARRNATGAKRTKRKPETTVLARTKRTEPPVRQDSGHQIARMPWPKGYFDVDWTGGSSLGTASRDFRKARYIAGDVDR